MSLITFSTFRSTLISEAFPAGEATRHAASHLRAVKEGLIDMQRWIPCLTARQIVTYPHPDTFFSRNMTLINLPQDIARQAILRVYTIANNDWLDFVDYSMVTKAMAESDAYNRVARPTGTPSSRPSWMYGTYYPTSTYDSDCGRSRFGRWAKDDNQLMLVPYIQSYEMVVVEYVGAKRKWVDTDYLDDDVWTDERRQCLKDFLLWRHEKDFGCDPAKTQYAEMQYRNSLAELIHDCRLEREGKPEEVRFLDRPLVAAEVNNDEASDSTTVEFMALGDMGEDTDETREVSELVKKFNPDWLLMLGDLNYDGGSPETFKNALTKYYDGWLGKMLPVWGNHDLEFELNGQYGGAMLELFPDIAELNSSKLYYRKVVGPVEFFVLNSGFSDAEPREPDGITEGSTQGLWLQAALADSTATWKIVLVHRAPYTDDTSYDPGITALRWPFLTWGADFVLSGHGHNYQRLTVDDLNYWVVGTGGTTLRGFTDTRSAESQFQAQEHGALRIIASSDSIQFVFYSKSGEVVDNTLFEV